MTNTSGLNLNADKTEVITQRGNHEPMNILYNNLVHNITPCSYMKVNGLQLGFNLEETRNKNFNSHSSCRESVKSMVEKIPILTS